MVIVKTVEEFQKKNEDELKDFMVYKTGIYDQDIIKDTLQEFYTRLIQSKALENFDENRAPSESENKLNYERWVCNNFCWLLPILRKKNYSGVLKIRLSKDDMDKKKKVSDSLFGDEDKNFEYETLRFYSMLNVKEDHADTQKDIFDVVNPSVKYNDYEVDKSFKSSIVEQEKIADIVRSLDSFFRYVRKMMTPKKATRIESYMKHKLKGLNSVDIAILMGISSNMVKFIKKEAREMYGRWMEEKVTA
jgi:hypothetical protein